MNIAWKFKKQFGYKYGQDLINGENLFLIQILLFASILKNQNFINQGLCNEYIFTMNLIKDEMIHLVTYVKKCKIVADEI